MYLLSACHVLGKLNAFGTSLHTGYRDAVNSGMPNNLSIKHYLVSSSPTHLIFPQPAFKGMQENINSITKMYIRKFTDSLIL